MMNNPDNIIHNLNNNNINISISNLFKEFSNKLINEVIKINQNTNKRLDNIEKKINLNKEEINTNMGNMKQINIPKTIYINNNKNNKPISKQKKNYLSLYENNHTLIRSQNFNDEIDYFENDSAHNS